MPEDTKQFDFDRVFRLFLTLGTLVGLVWLLAYLSDVLVPFALALLIAFLLNPIVNAFEQKTGRRGWAVLLTLSIFSVAVAVLVPLIGVMIYQEFRDIVGVLTDQKVIASIEQNLEPVKEWINSPEMEKAIKEYKESTNPEQVTAFILNAMPDAIKKMWDATNVVGRFLGGILNAIMALTGLVIIFLYLVFLMMDFNQFQAQWKTHLPPKYREQIVEYFDDFRLAMSRYFRGQFLVASCCGILFAVGFSLVGIRMAVVLGLFIGLLNMVPYLQSVGLIPAIMFALLRAFENDSSYLWSVLAVLLIFGVVQTIQDAFLVPRIMGKSTGLKPWIILLGICVWGKLLGFLGLVMAIPLSCLGLAYYRKFILEQKA